MAVAFINGFILGFSLIFVLGAQNIFVFRQGLTNKHVIPVALFCSLSDTLLISVGVLGVSVFTIDDVHWLSQYLYVFVSIWLFFYGTLRLKSAIFEVNYVDYAENEKKGLYLTLSMIFVLTFGNPHVYLDTVFLIGAVSMQYKGIEKIFYSTGASMASFVFFFTLCVGARFLKPIMVMPKAWNWFDFLVSILMFILSYEMLRGSGIF
ncbi:MAG: LysE family transporter [Pseudomonadota bacterium]|nr:LysE family transporter [Pseudomonadota bacterium]